MKSETTDFFVTVKTIEDYDQNKIYKLLPNELFNCIHSKSKVVLKPNWVFESHQYRKNDWEYIITHPTIITAVIRKVVDRLGSEGSIIIADAPTTEASFKSIIKRYPVDYWRKIASEKNILIQIIDLRDYEWKTKNGIIVERIALPGDPKGKTEVDLHGESSEFHGHMISKRGYHGADYNTSETNEAHNGLRNLYKVSRSIIESDVFINIPKLKTHRKAGITCCLKNLVGINTYKNFLPHHNEGGPKDGGDQFPKDNNINASIEGPLMSFLKKNILQNQSLMNYLSPLMEIGKKIFGDTRYVIRSGNWYGNDTVWRMILDLNKILFYAEPNGKMRKDILSEKKHYIGIVDGILAGEGHGPLAPEPVKMNYLIFGKNPIAIDTISSILMGFDPNKIPTISNSYKIKKFRFGDFSKREIIVQFNHEIFKIIDIPKNAILNLKPQFGWKDHIEY
jgi:uncharacterized protein (DUF362 family)